MLVDCVHTPEHKEQACKCVRGKILLKRKNKTKQTSSSLGVKSLGGYILRQSRIEFCTRRSILPMSGPQLSTSGRLFTLLCVECHFHPQCLCTCKPAFLDCSLGIFMSVQQPQALSGICQAIQVISGDLNYGLGQNLWLLRSLEFEWSCQAYFSHQGYYCGVIWESIQLFEIHMLCSNGNQIKLSKVVSVGSGIFVRRE